MQGVNGYSTQEVCDAPIDRGEPSRQTREMAMNMSGATPKATQRGGGKCKQEGDTTKQRNYLVRDISYMSDAYSQPGLYLPINDQHEDSHAPEDRGLVDKLAIVLQLVCHRGRCQNAHPCAGKGGRTAARCSGANVSRGQIDGYASLA